MESKYALYGESVKILASTATLSEILLLFHYQCHWQCRYVKVQSILLGSYLGVNLLDLIPQRN